MQIWSSCLSPTRTHSTTSFFPLTYTDFAKGLFWSQPSSESAQPQWWASAVPTVSMKCRQQGSSMKTSQLQIAEQSQPSWETQSFLFLRTSFFSVYDKWTEKSVLSSSTFFCHTPSSFAHLSLHRTQWLAVGYSISYRKTSSTNLQTQMKNLLLLRLVLS